MAEMETSTSPLTTAEILRALRDLISDPQVKREFEWMAQQAGAVAGTAASTFPNPNSLTTDVGAESARETAAIADILRSLSSSVIDLPIKDELEWTAAQIGAVAGTAASAFPGRNSLTTGAATAIVASAGLSGLRLNLDNTIADITKGVDSATRSNPNLLIAAPGENVLSLPAQQRLGIQSVRLQLNGDPVHDSLLYRGYVREIEKTLSSTFNADFATSDDAQAVAWRGLRQELWQETSKATLTSRYASGTSPAALRGELSPEALKGRLTSALLDKTGLTQRQALLGDLSTVTATTWRILAGTRDVLGIVGNAAIIDDPNASDAAKARAIADICRQGSTLLQIAGGVAIDAATGMSPREILKTFATRYAAGVDPGVLHAMPSSTARTAASPGASSAALKAAAGISLFAGLGSVASDATRIATSSDPILIAQSSTSLAATAAYVSSDLVRALATTTKATQVATKLGIAGCALGVVTGAVGLAGAIRDLQNNPTSGAAKWAVANSAIQIGAAVFAGVAAVVCPPAALLTVLLPDFGAIGRAIDLQSLKDDFWAQGLHHEWDVLKALHTIAALDATPMVNWFSGVYTPKIQGDMRSSMNTEWYWSAFDERAASVIREGTDHAEALKALRSKTGAAELIDISYNRADFNWLGQERSLFGTAVAVFDKNGHDTAKDRTVRGAAVAIGGDAAVKDDVVDHIVLIQANFDPSAARPADQAVGDGDTPRAAVAAGPAVELDRGGDNLVVVQAANSRVTSTGDSNDVYQVANGTDYDIDDRVGGKDEVRFAASGNGQKFTLQGKGIEFYTGSSYDDIVMGTAGADIYRSGGGNDQITLGAGNDQAVAGGASQLDLGDGDDLAFLTEIGSRVTGGAGQDAVFLTDAVKEAVSLTASAAPGEATLALSAAKPGEAPVSHLLGVEGVWLTAAADRVALALDAAGSAPAILDIQAVDTAAGDDVITSRASNVTISAEAGNDSITIGSGDAGGPRVEGVVVVAGPGDDSVSVAGDASLRVELNDGDDRISASQQTAGFIEIAAVTGGGHKSIDLGTANAVFRLGSTDSGELDVVDGRDRARAGHLLAFDFANESADRLVLTVSRDSSETLTCGIATVGGKLNIALHSANTGNSFICVGNEAYGIDAAAGLLSQQMASLGQRSASVQLSALPPEMHAPLNLAANPIA
ncbi:calcium-binding protein [Chelatococcus asaccharovorans]|uniref:Ca2+-binding RTX toxin-like protein n=1 Tax=Chelatococcus asaccharovorans TaxID=28210 RepID=A0A2V3UB58_9HYPH|nr:calcium-binding protein [Chelatococcus asaccharovorans]MBS7703415.1 hypothetical protein [Chelatococcus asaccharovorans]PXW61753.1 hypothetical protein C7450_103271 [Chelatococcus asaccharovorans]